MSCWVSTAFKEGKAKYGKLYSLPEGFVSVNIMHIEGDLCTIVAYVDKQNAELYKTEGGTENMIDLDTETELEME